MLSHFSRVQLFVTLWTVACPNPLSMGFSRQEYWSGLPFPSQGDLPIPGLLHCRQILYHLCHLGSPIVELLLLLLLSRFSRVRLCATPETAAHQAPPSLGFSRQEHGSGLPFPSPMHESEKWKWKVKVKSLSCVRLLATPWTTAYQAPLSMGFSRQEYWSGVPLPSPVVELISINFIISCDFSLLHD